MKLVTNVSNAMVTHMTLETYNEAIEQNRNDEVHGGLDQAKSGGNVGIVEVTSDFLLAVLEGEDQSYSIRDLVLSNVSISPKAQE